MCSIYTFIDIIIEVCYSIIDFISYTRVFTAFGPNKVDFLDVTLVGENGEK